MNHLHVMFFPFMAQGHMIPTLDMAKLFSSHGIKSTIITTPLNTHYFTKAIPKTENRIKIGIQTIKFPSTEGGLPDNCENTDQITRELLPNFFRATVMLKNQIEEILKEHRPDCLVADMFFPWATDIAAKYKIPRLVFHGTSFFTLCSSESIRLYQPQRSVLSDNEPFVLPNLPHEIKMTKSQLAQHQNRGKDTDPESEIGKLLREARESELTSFGVVINSFYELELDYADHYRNVMGRRAWHIGPVSLCNREREEKAQRGNEADIDEDKCLEWLNSKSPNSVIYVCFGSMAEFNASQLYEIAMALEETDVNFIWVLRKRGDNEEENETWLPEGFEERTKEMGLIIRGWAPQVLILDHEALGGFVTHCGWNSTLEGVTAGVPMVTWPLAADQFYNEKLVTEVLKIGSRVGASRRSSGVVVNIGKEEIAKAMNKIMVGEEATEMRNRARGLKEMAKEAVEEGGSSYSDLEALLQELSSYGA